MLYCKVAILIHLFISSFEVSSWNITDGALSRSELIKNVKGKFGIICYPPYVIDKEVIEAAGETYSATC